VYNPLTYNRISYGEAEKQYLYSLPPARATGMIVYSLYGRDMPTVTNYTERRGRSGLIRHTLHIPEAVRRQIVQKNDVRKLDGCMLYVFPGGFEVAKSSSQELSVDITDGRKTVALRIKAESGWHAVHRETGLPYDDGRPHNGHNGNDRYLWKLNNEELKKTDSNGYFGSPVHVFYSPRFYGQDLVVSFSPSVPFLLWEGIANHVEFPKQLA
jgi:hypothetical protein